MLQMKARYSLNLDTIRHAPVKLLKKRIMKDIMIVEYLEEYLGLLVG